MFVFNQHFAFSHDYEWSPLPLFHIHPWVLIMPHKNAPEQISSAFLFEPLHSSARNKTNCQIVSNAPRTNVAHPHPIFDWSCVWDHLQFQHARSPRLPCNATPRIIFTMLPYTHARRAKSAHMCSAQSTRVASVRVRACVCVCCLSVRSCIICGTPKPCLMVSWPHTRTYMRESMAYVRGELAATSHTACVWSNYPLQVMAKIEMFARTLYENNH